MPRQTTPGEITKEELKHRIGFHPATTEEARRAHEKIRELYLELAEQVAGYVPMGRELALAITAIEESMMWAHAGIARDRPLEK